jgi:hypothetical protein
VGHVPVVWVCRARPPYDEIAQQPTAINPKNMSRNNIRAQVGYFSSAIPAIKLSNAPMSSNSWNMPLSL